MGLEQLDRGIVQAAIRGDERAFQRIVETYRPAVLAFVGRMVRDPCLAEDIVQEVFLTVHQRLPGFSERSLFTTWLFQVAKNRVIDEFRALQRRPQADGSISAEALLEARHATAPEDRETVEAIWEAVSRLDEGLKLSLLLRDVAGLSYAEIAEVLDVDLGTVKWRIFRARERVQEALVREGLGRTPALRPAHVALAHAAAL